MSDQPKNNNFQAKNIPCETFYFFGKLHIIYAGELKEERREKDTHPAVTPYFCGKYSPKHLILLRILLAYGGHRQGHSMAFKTGHNSD